ncbi:MAG: methionine--tRNA ligase, partial [Candidatus Bathyarchaeota archaeon]
EGKTPAEFVAHWYEADRRDFKDLGISFDIFHQTSSKENIQFTQHIFTKLYEKGFFFERSVSQSYCEECKKVLPDRYVKGTCPHCNALEQYSDGCEECGKVLQPSEIEEPHCAICGSTPSSKESQHYFFRLSQFSKALEEWLTGNPHLQSEVKNYVLQWISAGLEDWDVTRDLTWGVPIPLSEAKGKVLYNWFDNHLCYISTTLKYFADRGIDGREFWNSARIYHFIGKDIVYHHYLFLPAMRLGAEEFKLPDLIPTRGHLLLHGAKFSKSRGWFVSLRAVLNLFPADYLRYYLTAITPYSQSDVNFDWEGFQARINNELIANIGNFIHRTLTFIWSNYDGKVPKAENYDALDTQFRGRIEKVANDVGKEIEIIELSKGLRKILEFSDFCNRYFQRKEPWANRKEASTCLHLCVNAVKSLAILLAPYLPLSAEVLWEQLKLEGTVHEQKWDSASKLSLKGGQEISKPRVLFRKVEAEEVEREKQKLLGRSREPS